MIVAFLQNAWFKPGTRPRTIEQYKHNILFRRRVLAGSRSGSRLFKTLGEDLFDKIWWDNTTQETGDVSSSIFLPDELHIRRVLSTQTPELVLTFGKSAQDALVRCWEGSIIAAPHPASRVVTDNLLMGVGHIIHGGSYKANRLRVRLQQARGAYHCVPLDGDVLTPVPAGVAALP